MYKHSGLIVIAALVISAMGVLAPATTPIVAATDPTVTLTPDKVRDNGYVLLTLTVTNPSDSENIENILIQDVSTGIENYFFDNVDGAVIFGENVDDNLGDNTADNLIEAGNQLGQVAENLRRARVAILAAADALQTATNYLDNAGDEFANTGRENLVDAGTHLKTADDYLQLVVAALRTEPTDYPGAAENLILFAQYIGRAGFTLQNDEYELLKEVGENLDNFADNIENYAITSELSGVANYLSGVQVSKFHQYLNENIDWLENLIPALKDNYDNTSAATVLSAAQKLDNFVSELRQFSENMRQAGENIENAGRRLENIRDTQLENCDNILTMWDDVGGAAWVHFLNWDFIENIKDAGDNMAAGDDNNENILKAGEALENAANAQNIWLGTSLASNLIGYDGEITKTSARYWIAEAGVSLKDNENINLTAAASALDNAAAQLIAAGNQINTTKADLTPTSQWGAISVTKGVILHALNHDNAHITPGGSQTFTFLALAPNTDASEDHTIRVWTYDTDNNVLGQDDFTITVDGKPASIDVKFTQTSVVDYLGTAVDNLVGQVYDNAKVTLTITADEEITSFGTMRIENYKQFGDNLELTISDFTTTDNMVFTYEFYTTDWAENLENTSNLLTNGPRLVIEGPSTTDTYGVENESTVYCYFEVDLIPPLFVSNGDPNDGLTQFRNLTDMRKPGTDNDYHVSTLKRWTISGRAEDNENHEHAGDADNAKWAMTTVYVNDTALEMSRLSDDNFTVTENLVEGVNIIRVTVVDRVGLSVENSLDNVFIDNTVPTVAGVTLAGETWTDNTLVIGDNKPTFRLKIQDTGWGIPRDNVLVTLCENNDLATSIENLENYGVWDNGACADTYNFENTYDNDNKGLTNGTYYIIVTVSDNLHDNDNWIQYFQIDITAPSAPASVTGSVSAGSTAATKQVITTTSITILGTAEVDATIKVEKSTDNGVTWVEDTDSAAQDTADASGNWSVTISVTEGVVTGIKVSATDGAGNESTTTLFGYVLSDSTAPTVAITSPATGTTMDAVSVTITGTVTKDDWETWDDLTMIVQVGTSSVTVPISVGTFTYSVALAEGVNTILVSVTDGVNTSATDTVSITRTVTPWATYAIIVVIVALILAAIAIFRKK